MVSINHPTPLKMMLRRLTDSRLQGLLSRQQLACYVRAVSSNQHSTSNDGAQANNSSKTLLKTLAAAGVASVGLYLYG